MTKLFIDTTTNWINQQLQALNIQIQKEKNYASSHQRNP